VPNDQLAILADKATRMKSLGEIDILVVEQSTKIVVLRLRALVVKELGVECYAGQTFHLDNGVVGNVSAKTISLHNGRFRIIQNLSNRPAVAHPPPYFTIYDKTPPPLRTVCVSDQHQSPGPEISTVSVDPPIISRQPESKSRTISITNQKFLLPDGEYEIRLENEPANKTVLIVPQSPKLPVNKFDFEPPTWEPQICPVVNGNALYTNYSPEPLHHLNNVHFQAI
jgi:hypothetical protein